MIDFSDVNKGLRPVWYDFYFYIYFLHKNFCRKLSSLFRKLIFKFYILKVLLDKVILDQFFLKTLLTKRNAFIKLVKRIKKKHLDSFFWLFKSHAKTGPYSFCITYSCLANSFSFFTWEQIISIMFYDIILHQQRSWRLITKLLICDSSNNFERFEHEILPWMLKKM